MVEKALVCPPRSRLTPLTPDERAAVMKASVLAGHYEQAVDRESAYEKLKARTETAAGEDTPAPGRRGRTAEPKSETAELFGAMAKSAARAIGSQVGRQLIRGVLGSLFGGGRR